MPTLRLFGPVREAAGLSSEHVDELTVDEVVEAAVIRYGEPFVTLLKQSRIWVNGEDAVGTRVLAFDDEIAILPPVSGG